MVYVTSDLHFAHCKPFLYEPRGFSSIEEHDQGIIENWNLTVKEDDEVYILGDLMLGDNDYGIKCLSSLAGRKHIILGNHDGSTKIPLYSTLDNTDILGYATMIRSGKYHLYLSHYPTITSNWDYDKPLKARVLNLCGHTHTKDRWSDWNKGLIYHVELDAHDNKPKPLDEIIEEVKAKIRLDNAQSNLEKAIQDSLDNALKDKIENLEKTIMGGAY